MPDVPRSRRDLAASRWRRSAQRQHDRQDGPAAPPPPPPLRPFSFAGLCIMWGFVAFFALLGVFFLVVVGPDFRSPGAGFRPSLSGVGLGILMLAGAAGTAWLTVWQQRRGASNIEAWEREHGTGDETSPPVAD